MNRRAFLKAIGSAALLPILPRRLLASTNFRRRRPSDAAWPSQSAWKRLDEAVGGNLHPLIQSKTIPKKETVFVSLRPEEVVKIVDASIALVRRIETEVQGRPQKWLRERSESGLFPDNVFS